MTSSLFKRAIRHSVAVFNNTNPAPALRMTEDRLLEVMKTMRFHAADTFATYPVLYLPPDYDVDTDPIILQSGQHRVTALLQLFSHNSDYSGYTEGLFTPKTVGVRGFDLINNC
jgi:hypothetical protein